MGDEACFVFDTLFARLYTNSSSKLHGYSQDLRICRLNRYWSTGLPFSFLRRPRAIHLVAILSSYFAPSRQRDRGYPAASDRCASIHRVWTLSHRRLVTLFSPQRPHASHAARFSIIPFTPHCISWCAPRMRWERPRHQWPRCSPSTGHSGHTGHVDDRCVVRRDTGREHQGPCIQRDVYDEQAFLLTHACSSPNNVKFALSCSHFGVVKSNHI